MRRRRRGCVFAPNTGHFGFACIADGGADAGCFNGLCKAGLLQAGDWRRLRGGHRLRQRPLHQRPLRHLHRGRRCASGDCNAGVCELLGGRPCATGANCASGTCDTSGFCIQSGSEACTTATCMTHYCADAGRTRVSARPVRGRRLPARHAVHGGQLPHAAGRVLHQRRPVRERHLRAGGPARLPQVPVALRGRCAGGQP